MAAEVSYRVYLSCLREIFLLGVVTRDGTSLSCICRRLFALLSRVRVLQLRSLNPKLGTGLSKPIIGLIECEHHKRGTTFFP
jgi:hypothetical protein